MATTIRINEDIKQLLKLKSVQTGVSQLDLANRYILKGLKEDETPNKEVMSIEEIEKLLQNDGNNNLNQIDGIVEFANPTDAVQLKKESYNRS